MNMGSPDPKFASPSIRSGLNGLRASWASMKARPDGPVSMLGVKAAARNLLPPGSLARKMILAEDDALPLEEALGKFAVFDRLLTIELARPDMPE